MTIPLISRALPFRHLCLVLLASTAAPLFLHAAPQTVTIKTDTDFYSLTYDDQNISSAEIQNVLYLSPYYPVDIPSPYFMTSSMGKKQGKVVRVKQFISIPLEQCNPGYAECKHPQLSPAFFTNAQENLDKTVNALNILRVEKIPDTLEPVRTYLLRHLQESLSIEQARFRFLKTGDLQELIKVQCGLCKCENGTTDLRDLKPIPQDEGDRLEWSRLIWYNRVLECIRKHDSAYPMQAWETFIKTFNIQEIYRASSPL